MINVIAYKVVITRERWYNFVCVFFFHFILFEWIPLNVTKKETSSFEEA